jgi:hypothetical protein
VESAWPLALPDSAERANLLFEMQFHEEPGNFVTLFCYTLPAPRGPKASADRRTC